MSDKELSVYGGSVEEVLTQIKMVEQVMAQIMVKGEHYGPIPGTKKNILLKPGAEKLCSTFRLAPDYVVTEKALPNNHLDVSVKCSLTQISTGRLFGSGIGSCSTLETKYRYRRDGTRKIENPDIADTWNTVRKMAAKRAYVAATISATAASDIFTQDLEDSKPAAPRSEPRSENGTAQKARTGEALRVKIEKTWVSDADGKDEDQRHWYNAMSNGRRFWTRKPELGETLIDAQGLDVILYVQQSKKRGDIYQVFEIEFPAGQPPTESEPEPESPQE